MSKLSKLLIVGSGVAVANFYTKNPKKLEEHTGYVKKKAKDYYGYTRCMIRYTKKNGVEDAVVYMYNDFKNVVKRTRNSIENKYNYAVEYGKELSNNAAEIKEHASDIKDYTKELKENISSAKEIREEISPALNLYKKQLQSSLSTIKEQVAEIKETVANSNTTEKIELFKQESSNTINNVKEQLEDVASSDEKEENQ